MSAIRCLRHVSLSANRAFAVRATSRTLSRAALPVFAVRAAPVCASTSRPFSASARALGEGASDVSLAQKLGEELQYEKEAAAEADPDFLKSLKAQGVWSIEDVAGNDEIALSRKFGNEAIRLMFSIADIQNEQEGEFDQPEEGEEANPEEGTLPSYPIRCSVSITKSGAPGALTVDAMCQEGAFVVDNISFYTDAKVGTELTAEADWKRRGLYIGPQFDTLDVAVQEEFERFLQERGINESLAMFIPEYAEYKEQKEYVSWLQHMKSFVEA
ncbi:hypothetical protein IEO21_07193 [Rhodonia placenta]|uniref:Mitochondrial glyco protein n=1 Tax=Rhodonia placenta TaxID=104341 RepID=A0A8H7NYG3_9APHY|nr:hypothetical protein IEO21_07193 [Postia placenta]